MQPVAQLVGLLAGLGQLGFLGLERGLDPGQGFDLLGNGGQALAANGRHLAVEQAGGPDPRGGDKGRGHQVGLLGIELFVGYSCQGIEH